MIEWLAAHKNHDLSYEKLKPYTESMEKLLAKILNSIKDKSYTLTTALQKEHSRKFNREGVRRWLNEREPQQDQPPDDASMTASGNNLGERILSDENKNSCMKPISRNQDADTRRWQRR